jgi:hypothetical protein
MGSLEMAEGCHRDGCLLDNKATVSLAVEHFTKTRSKLSATLFHHIKEGVWGPPLPPLASAGRRRDEGLLKTKNFFT